MKIIKVINVFTSLAVALFAQLSYAAICPPGAPPECNAAYAGDLHHKIYVEKDMALPRTMSFGGELKPGYVVVTNYAGPLDGAPAPGTSYFAEMTSSTSFDLKVYSNLNDAEIFLDSFIIHNADKTLVRVSDGGTFSQLGIGAYGSNAKVAQHYFSGNQLGNNYIHLILAEFPTGESFIDQSEGTFFVELYEVRDVFGSPRELVKFYSGNLILLGASEYKTFWEGNGLSGYYRYLKRRYFIQGPSYTGYVAETIGREDHLGAFPPKE
jgi:hypothetical protein